MEIKGLKFIQTCGACPEQYDVTDGRGHKVAYVRLRWGHFTVECPYVNGEIVYEHQFNDAWQGIFNDEFEREKYLFEAAKAIKRWKKQR